MEHKASYFVTAHSFSLPSILSTTILNSSPNQPSSSGWTGTVLEILYTLSHLYANSPIRWAWWMRKLRLREFWEFNNSLQCTQLIIRGARIGAQDPLMSKPKYQDTCLPTELLIVSKLDMLYFKLSYFCINNHLPEVSLALSHLDNASLSIRMELKASVWCNFSFSVLPGYPILTSVMGPTSLNCICGPVCVLSRFSWVRLCSYPFPYQVFLTPTSNASRGCSCLLG